MMNEENRKKLNSSLHIHLILQVSCLALKALYHRRGCKNSYLNEITCADTF